MISITIAINYRGAETDVRYSAATEAHTVVEAIRLLLSTRLGVAATEHYRDVFDRELAELSAGQQRVALIATSDPAPGEFDD